MRPVLAVVAIGVALAAAVLGLDLPGASGARIPVDISERLDISPSAVSAPARARSAR